MEGHFVSAASAKAAQRSSNRDASRRLPWELSPEMDRIAHVVSEFYNTDETQLYLSKRGSFNEPRNVAIYLARKLRRDTLAQISERFSINGYSTVSSIIARTEERMKTDSRLKMNIIELTALVGKSQEQT